MSESSNEVPANLERSTIPRIDPGAIAINGIRPIQRTFHQDARGFLIETLRADDAEIRGSEFAMTYSSLTVPGQFRDADRWHLHQQQTDRFVVILGEMTLALMDDRKDSPSYRRLEVVRLNGLSFQIRSTGSIPAYLVPIPPGVLHCVGNLGNEPFLLQNCPTELYNPADEGRVPFESKVVAGIDRPFSWSLVDTRSVSE